MMKTVFVGMSGGVDSSVSAALLKEQGYIVVGVYMKNWSQDLPGMPCTWQQDYQDAKRVAVQLGIDFKVYDFETQYRQKVVDYMVTEYKAGRTPNPDIMCNQEIKFKLFLDTALEDGADLIATGHYARVFSNRKNNAKSVRGPSSHKNTSITETNNMLNWGVRGRTSHTRSSHFEEDNPREEVQLHTAVNSEKDQTYFLYRLTEQALSRTLFPIGDFITKDEVRAVAKRMGLATAEKKDSQGICFVGKVGIKDFLLHELGPQKPGKIVDQKGKEIGTHDGAIFYTIGQRHGLDVGGGLPYYVFGKDMSKNEVYVTTDIQDDKLWRQKVNLADLHWIGQPPENSNKIMVRMRYRASLVEGKLDGNTLTLTDPVRAISPGQSAVFYSKTQVLGGGIVV